MRTRERERGGGEREGGGEEKERGGEERARDSERGGKRERISLLRFLDASSHL